MHLSIVVPATCANLGSGYDSIGFAVSNLTDTLEVFTDDDYHDLRENTPVEIVARGYYAAFSDSAPSDHSNMVYRLILEELERLGVNVPFAITCYNNIPHARGLGSSSAAIVSALRAAYLIAREYRTDDTLPSENQYVFARALEIEGHPDNVAPCIFGGIQLASPDGKSVSTIHLTKTLHIVTLINPERGLKTSKAREVIPDSILHSDAVKNTRNLANLVLALSAGSNHFLLESTADYLHQEYRRKLYHKSMELVDNLRTNGIPSCISGAGTTVVAFWFEDAEFGDDIAKAFDNLAPDIQADGWVIHHSSANASD